MFFLLGVTQLVLASLWWAWVLVGRSVPDLAPPAATAPSFVHAVSMLASFLPLFMFGFLFTAGPRWLLVEPLPTRAWWTPAVVAGASITAFWPLQLFAPAAASAALALYAIAWIYFCVRFAGLFRASPATDRVHAGIVGVALLVGALLTLAAARLGPAAHALLRPVGIWGFLTPVFIAVSHRMIPFFTGSALSGAAVDRPWWVLAAMLAPVPVHLAAELGGLTQWTWVVDLPVGVGMLALVMRWKLVQSLRLRMLAMLHLAFAWYGASLLLYGAQSAALLAGHAILGLAPMHALTIGFFTGLMVAMVTRVTRGHSGRPLTADHATWALYLGVHALALLRVGAELAASPTLTATTGVAFFAVLGIWAIRQLPIYLMRRPDGRPG